MRRSHITFSRLTVQGGVWIENDWQTLLKGITCIFCCVLILFIFLTWGHFQSPPVTSCFNFSKKPQKDQMSEKGSWRMRLKVMRNKALNHSSSVNILCPSHINRFSSTMVVVLLWRQQLLWSYVTFIPCFVMIDGSIVEEMTYSIYSICSTWTSRAISCLMSHNNGSTHGKEVGCICTLFVKGCEWNVQICLQVTKCYKTNCIMAPVPSYFLLYLVYDAQRLHCWGYNCVYTCQRDIILSQSDKFFVHFWQLSGWKSEVSARKFCSPMVPGTQHTAGF